jgi:hypothetical protein
MTAMTRRAARDSHGRDCPRRCCLAFAQTDPLPSWNDGKAKSAIVDFIARAAAEERDFDEGRWGAMISAPVNENSDREKFSLQVLYPHPPARIVPSPERTMGVVLTSIDIMHRKPMKKNYRCKSYTPRPTAGEERDCGQRTMGVVSMMSAPS